MMLAFRKFLNAVFTLALSAAAAVASANDFPDRPIKFVVPLGPGSGLDTYARFVAEKAAVLLGQTIIVESRPGGNTIIGTQAVLTAPADGYTVLMISPTSMVLNPLMQKSLSYEPLRDFRPIAGMNRSGAVLVTSANSPYKSLQEVVEAAKAKPGSVSLATYSDYYRLGTVLFEKQAGISFNHIPFKGASEAMTSLAGGNVDVALMAAGAAAPLVSSGKLRPLGVTTKERVEAPEYSKVPTFDESGFPGFELFVWTGFAVKAGTPDPVAKKLEETFSQVVASPEFRRFVQSQGGEVPFVATGAQLTDVVRNDDARYRKLLEAIK